MPIKYDKLIVLMRENGITSYTIKRDKVIGQATYKKIMEGGDIDTRSIAKLCGLLNCQPGDILEYVPETVPAAPEPSPSPNEIPVFELDLSVGTFNTVCRYGCKCVGDVIDLVNSGKIKQTGYQYKEIISVLEKLKQNKP